MFLKISPSMGVIKFGVRVKLSPIYLGPFEILEKVGEVAYKLAMSPSLEGVHNVLHMSQMRRYVKDENYVVDYSELELHPNLSYTSNQWP